ncbi:hypothetical protein [Bradyrhizobium sp. HKCCYLS20291]|uniref:hypothetical protein n=2 Tax=unclassified Bradyrhizobium TaxID=2631580 RepID=UPI003EBDA9D1
MITLAFSVVQYLQEAPPPRQYLVDRAGGHPQPLQRRIHPASTAWAATRVEAAATRRIQHASTEYAGGAVPDTARYGASVNPKKNIAGTCGMWHTVLAIRRVNRMSDSLIQRIHIHLTDERIDSPEEVTAELRLMENDELVELISLMLDDIMEGRPTSRRMFN